MASLSPHRWHHATAGSLNRTAAGSGTAKRRARRDRVGMPRDPYGGPLGAAIRAARLLAPPRGDAPACCAALRDGVLSWLLYRLQDHPEPYEVTPCVSVVARVPGEERACPLRR